MKARRVFSLLALVVLLVGLMPLLPVQAQEGREINYAYVDWTDNLAVANIAKIVLEEELGYKVNLVEMTAEEVFKALAKGEVDVFSDMWMPTTHGPYWEQYGTKLDKISPVYKGARRGLAVPAYVEEVNSIEDLNNYVDDFRGKIIGIGAGSALNEQAKAAIEQYGLNFELVEDSEAAMSTAFRQAYQNEEPIVVTLWSPHYLWAEHEIKYLEDPAAVFGKEEWAWNVARKGFRENMPEAAKFFANFYFEAGEVAGLMADLIVDGMAPEEAARQFVDGNAEVVAAWLAEGRMPLPEGPIVVGLINHLTGDAAPYGQSMKKGTEVALKEINDAGGIKGHLVEVIYEDDRLSAADAQTAFLKLVETDKVPVIMGSGSSTVSLSICPRAQEKRVVQISSISTAPTLKECGPYFFSVMASDTAQGPEWVKVAEYLGVNEAAVMYINNDYGIGVKDTFVEAFEAAGGKVLIAQPFELGAKDFRTEILKVKATNPKVVFIVDHVAEGSIVLKQALELGLEVQWVTDVSMVAQEVIDLAGEASERVMGLRAGSTQTPEYKRFKEAFVEMHNEPPTIWADFAYDTMMMVAKAIEWGGYDSDGIRKALFRVGETYVGPSGSKRFDPYGIAEGVYEWVVVKDGQWVLYEK